MVNYIRFPDLHNTNEDGLLAMGGDLSLDTLISAYKQGIFPWFNEGQPILWWSPDPRLVLYPDRAKVSRSTAKLIRQQHFQFSCDQAFEQIVKNCALRGSEKPFQAKNRTWITNSMQQAYLALFNAGYAHSIEVWQNNNLVGGLYGVVLGKVFFGESMFSAVSNTSKLALVSLCQHLENLKFNLIDCQVESTHLVSLGAEQIPRSKFLSYLSGIDIEKTSPDFGERFSFS